MKKWISITLGILLFLAALGAAGFAGFRIGLGRSSGVAHVNPATGPQVNHFDRFPNYNNFGRSDRPNMPGPFGGSRFVGIHGGFFSAFILLAWTAVKLFLMGILIWLGFSFAKNSGWQLARSNENSNAQTTSQANKVKGRK